VAKAPTPQQDIPAELTDIVADNQAAWDALATVRETWNDKERLLVGRLADQYSKNNPRSRVTDAMLSTLAWERQMRVCSQLPSGTLFVSQNGTSGSDRNVQSDKNKRLGALMNSVFFKYVIPNADSQFEALTKLRMSGVYASVYGAQFMLYDYRIDDGGYIGPDFWLLPARNVMPQPGRNSINDCAWVDVSTVVNKGYIDAIVDRKSTKWELKALKALQALVKDGAAPARDQDGDKKSAVENGNDSSSPSMGKTPRIELVTRYERGKEGRWITWAPDYPQAGILRSIKNPHGSGKIPIVARYCFPLLDSIFGLGDFERGMTLQKSKDSLINLYLEAVKMSIFPPLKMDPSLLTPSTIKWQAGSKWLVKDMTNAVQAMATNPMGTDTFQGTSQFLNTALMNQFGTTQTTSTAGQSSNPEFGKTPEALEMQGEKESARDNWDRYMLETCVQELYEGMANLLCTNQEKPITYDLHDEDLEALRSQYDDGSAKEVFKDINDRSAKLTVTKSMLPNGVTFFVDPNSTLQQNEAGQTEALTKIMGFYMQNPQAVDQLLGADNMKFNFGAAFKQFVYNSGVADPDKIITDTEKEQQGKQVDPNQPDQQPQPSIGAQQQMGSMQGATPQPQFDDPEIAAIAQQLMGSSQQQQPVGASNGQ
jgi:hypothetical protein